MATTTMNWDNLIKAVEIDVVDSASDAKMVEPTVLMIQKLRLTSAVLPTAVSVICVCIACAMDNRASPSSGNKRLRTCSSNALTHANRLPEFAEQRSNFNVDR